MSDPAWRGTPTGPATASAHRRCLAGDRPNRPGVAPVYASDRRCRTVDAPKEIP
jgi:hypothetical protein